MIARERPIQGSDEILAPEPLKTFRIEGSKMIPVEVNLDDFVKIGENMNYEYFRPKV
jgi:hypothetical protein